MEYDTDIEKNNLPVTKTVIVILVLIVSIWIGGSYREPIRSFFQKVSLQGPCEKEITYSIGTFDNQFGISKADYLDMINTAAQVWNTALNKDVFVYQENGNLQINLLYDARQDATLKLQRLGLTIKQDQASYNALKEKYNSLLAYYSQQQSAINARKTAYNAQKSAYESQVAYWQSKGGAPKNEYNQLEQQRQQLNNESLSINQATAELNKTVDSINAAATVLNRLAGALNINAQMYNGIGLAQGEEFQEGVYKVTNGKTEIDIYQFDNKTKLIRVLIHEMGHALGVNHVSDPNAIMYEINSGTNLNLTNADITALKNVCNIK